VPEHRLVERSADRSINQSINQLIKTFLYSDIIYRYIEMSQTY